MTTYASHKKVLDAAKGFRGRSSTCFRPAIERLEKSWLYAYRDRKNKKRDFRALWIQRINAAVGVYNRYNNQIEIVKEKELTCYS